MRGYLAVVAKKHRHFRRDDVAPYLDDRVRRASAVAFPPSFGVGEPLSWRRLGVTMWGWTNEPGAPPLIVTEDKAEGVAGYRGNDGSGSGVWAKFRSTRRGLTASTSATRVEPVYWAEDREHIYVGSNALLVHLAMTGASRPIYDMGYVAGYLNAEFALGDATPFAGVTALANDSTLEADKNGIRIVPASESQSEGADQAKRLAEALVAAVLPLGDSHVLTGLTGGRDSRLVVAALRAAGVSFATYTTGHKDHPDVVIASRIARILGVEHQVREPAVISRPAGNVLVVDPLKRARNAIRLCQGMVSAYENVGTPGPFNGTVPKLGGHGGELLRGGYGHYARSIEVEDAERYLKNLLTRNSGILTDEARAEWNGFVDPWLQSVRGNPAASLYDFYLRYRAGRWSAAARSAYTVRDRLVQPLFDHNVVKVASQVDARVQINERLVHKALWSLAPELVDVPFFGSRWRFEERGPAAGEDRAKWSARQPLNLSGSPSAAFNWRIQYGVEVRDLFRDQILGDSRAAALFNVVDREQVTRLLDQAPPGPAKVLWSLFTLSVMLSGSWLDRETGSTPVDVPVP